MNKLFIGSLSAGIIIVLQGFFAAPALAQQYQYQSQYYQPQYYGQYGSTYPMYYNYPYNTYPYGYPNNNQYYNNYYQYPYNYNYGYGYNYGQLSVSGVSGPTQLTVGQGGTWSVSVNGYPGQLSYSVVWGDEGTYGYAASPAVVNTGSLSHVYLKPGTYTPRFTVTDAWGRSVSASITVVVSGGCSYYTYYGCQTQPQYPYNYPYSYPYVY
jgi:hypothetical protein